ncbi:hypothetical protein D3C86_1426400 [compost metagenome]
MRHRQIGQGLVAARIQGADDQGPSVQGVGDGLILGQLLVLGRGALTLQEEEFGAQQTAALGAPGHGGRGLGHVAQIGEDLDADAVCGAAVLGGQGSSLGAAAVAGGGGALGAGLACRGRAGDQPSAVGVQHHQGAVLDPIQTGADRDQGRHAHGRGQDGDVRGRPAARGAQARYLDRVQRDQLRRQKVVGQDD